MKILAIKLSSLGDLFHALPAVHILKHELSASIDWATTNSYRELVSCFSDVDRVVPFYRRDFFSNLRPFLSALRQEKYDLVVDFQGLLKSALVARLAHGQRVIGPSFHREGTRIFYSSVAGPCARRRHAVEQNLDVVRHLGLPVSAPCFPIDVPAHGVRGDRPRIGLLPVSRWTTKNWPQAHWVALIESLTARGVTSLFLLGGPGDRGICEEIRRAAGGGVENLAGRLSLVETCGVVATLDLLVANDSGPVHMAAALGTRCLVLFGPTDPDRTGPYGAEHQVLRLNLDCMPCLSRTCRIGTHACLRGLPPSKVATAAMDMLAEKPTGVSAPPSGT